MSLKNEETKVNIISGILSGEGFDVKKDFKIGERFYADILGIKGDKAVLIEVKPSNFKIDQSDLMQLSGSMGTLRESRQFENMNISGCIFASGGTISPAEPLVSELGIHLIVSDKKEEITKDLRKCLLEDITNALKSSK